MRFNIPFYWGEMGIELMDEKEMIFSINMQPVESSNGRVSKSMAISLELAQQFFWINGYAQCLHFGIRNLFSNRRDMIACCRIKPAVNLPCCKVWQRHSSKFFHEKRNQCPFMNVGHSSEMD